MLKGSKPISKNLAKKLEYVFDADAQFGLNLQLNYDAALARQNVKDRTQRLNLKRKEE